MSQTLFFNTDDSLENFASELFKELGIKDTKEGDSSFHKNYVVGSISGLDIKLAENNYDYEELYKFMIIIKKSIGTKLDNEEYILREKGEFIANLITSKFSTVVALELELRKSDAFSLKVFTNSVNGVLSEIKDFVV